MDLKHQHSHLNKERNFSNCFMCLRCTRNGLVQKFPNETSNDYIVQCRKKFKCTYSKSYIMT